MAPVKGSRKCCRAPSVNQIERTRRLELVRKGLASRVNPWVMPIDKAWEKAGLPP